MLPGIFQSLVMLATAGAFFALDGWYSGRFDARQQLPTGIASRDRWAGVIAIAVLTILVAQPVALPWLGLSLNGGWGLLAQVSGVVMLVAGLALNGWARAHLQHFYTYGAKIQHSHQVIESGPYARVRHPIFTAYFSIVIGLLLVNPSLPTLALAIYTLWNFTRSAMREERVLTADLPGYAAYCARTGRFRHRRWLVCLMALLPSSARSRSIFCGSCGMCAR